jgi:hypothetical protein
MTRDGREQLFDEDLAREAVGGTTPRQLVPSDVSDDLSRRTATGTPGR